MRTRNSFTGHGSPEKAAFHIRYRHILIAAAGWILFLFLFFLSKAAIQPIYFIHCRLDDLIPFEKWAILPYCLWYFYLAGALLYFAIASKPDFLRLQLYVLGGMFLCLVIYIIFPNAINFRPTVIQHDLLSRMVILMFSIDSSTMVIPSMHVFVTVAVHLSLASSKLTRRNTVLIALSFVVMVLICASTVFLKQHSVLDVLCGIALAFALYYPAYRINWGKLLRR
ncbi:MAG: phosphatase PAP2 family protein [Clostridia bacterium]|nr:phosphatase PAP2 family protein [Clostridia bacterium]MDR3644569.1 phosphatase PAP2 family protein [Clostridia bacterium]